MVLDDSSDEELDEQAATKAVEEQAAIEEEPVAVLDAAMDEIEEEADSKGVPICHAMIAKPFTCPRSFSSATRLRKLLLLWPPAYQLRLISPAVSASYQ